MIPKYYHQDDPEGQDQPGESVINMPPLSERTDPAPASNNHGVNQVPKASIAVNPIMFFTDRHVPPSSEHTHLVLVSGIHGYIRVPVAPNTVNPIMSQFQGQELGKAILGAAVPLTTGLLLNQYKDLTLLKARLIVIALSLGFAGTWNGMLLRGMHARIASAMENVGVALIIVAFYGLVSSFFPPALEWVSWLCCVLSCLPLVLSYFPIKSAEGTTQPISLQVHLFNSAEGTARANSLQVH